jgi:hypothetical protein
VGLRPLQLTRHKRAYGADYGKEKPMKDFETYRDEDPNVIGEATYGDKTVVFITAAGETLNWERLVLFPTLDENRVIIATPYEPLVGLREVNPEQVDKYLNNFLSEAVMLAEKHFDMAN